MKRSLVVLGALAALLLVITCAPAFAGPPPPRSLSAVYADWRYTVEKNLLSCVWSWDWVHGSTEVKVFINDLYYITINRRSGEYGQRSVDVCGEGLVDYPGKVSLSVSNGQYWSVPIEVGHVELEMTLVTLRFGEDRLKVWDAMASRWRTFWYDDWGSLRADFGQWEASGNGYVRYVESTDTGIYYFATWGKSYWYGTGRIQPKSVIQLAEDPITLPSQCQALPANHFAVCYDERLSSGCYLYRNDVYEPVKICGAYGWEP